MKHPLLPKSKLDVETARKLPGHTYEELKPIIPQLLTWIQDINWPVAEIIGNYLQTISEHLTEDILYILKTDDDVWKYWTLNIFGLWTSKRLQPEVLEEVKRIATNPTPGERKDEVYDIAVEILENYAEEKQQINNPET